MPFPSGSPVSLRFSSLRSPSLLAATLLAWLPVVGCTTADSTSSPDDTQGDTPLDDTAPDTAPDTGDPVGPPTASQHATIGSIVVVRWAQSATTDTVRVEFSFEGGAWETSPTLPGTIGDHEVLLLGIPYGMAVVWRVVAVTGGTTDRVYGHEITTGDRPAGLPTFDLQVADADRWDPTGRFLLTSVSERDPMVGLNPAFWVVMIDRAGRYVWALPADPASWTLYPKPSRDGRRLLYEDCLFWTQFDGGQGGLVHQVAIDGSESRQWATPGLAHAFDDVSDDTIVWFATVRGDEMLTRSVADGTAEDLWACADWIRTSDIADHPEDPSAETCGSNGLSWNPERNSYVVSLWSHETVLELDAADRSVRWYAEPWGGHGYQIAEGSPDWYWQHEAQILDDGRLLLSSGVDPLENGDFGATATYAYRVDDDARTLTLDFAYTSEPDWAARYKGAPHVTTGGNIVQSYGSAGGYKELTPEGEVVWQARMTDGVGAWSGRAYWVGDLYAFLP